MAFFDLAVKVKTKEIADAVLYILQLKLENMVSQLGYVRALDTDMIWIWAGGNRIQMERLAWIDLAEQEIAKCNAHIVAMSAVKE